MILTNKWGFIPCNKCEEGWVKVYEGQTAGGNLVDKKFGAMVRCECFKEWLADWKERNGK